MGVATEDDSGNGEEPDEKGHASIFGKKNQVCIYTGKIIEVADDNPSFLHDINTFKGCSGAAIFLLGGDGLVDESMCGYAIGVQAGGLVNSLENIGFRME